jgi:ribonucleoside-diphosphate reductase beta chain
MNLSQTYSNVASKEVLLDPSENRLALFPIKYQEIWDEYEKQQAAFWTSGEIDFSADLTDFQKLNKDEQYFIKNILAFFSQSDSIVNINLAENFTREVQVKEAVIAYQYQIMMENIHTEVYSLQIENIITDKEEKMRILNGVETIPCIAKKAKWAMNWIESDAPFSQRLIAFAIMEGVFFSGSFCSIFWLKSRNLMPGLITSNELIARDEGMHTGFACLLYKYIKNKLSKETVHDMFKEAVDIEIEFICESLPCRLLGMNNELMTQYIKFVADRLLIMLGYTKIWKVDNPFPWMESISMEGKTNFFEQRVTQYKKFKPKNEDDSSFEITDDF